MAAVLTRLSGSPSLISNDNVKRSHLILVDTADCPAVYVVDGSHRVDVKNLCAERAGSFIVRIFTSGDTDAAKAEAWAIAHEVLVRLNPANGTYPAGVVVSEGPMQFDQEVANEDLQLLEMQFGVRYSTDAWSLN